MKMVKKKIQVSLKKKKLRVYISLESQIYRLEKQIKKKVRITFEFAILGETELFLTPSWAPAGLPGLVKRGLNLFSGEQE